MTNLAIINGQDIENIIEIADDWATWWTPPVGTIAVETINGNRKDKYIDGAFVREIEVLDIDGNKSIQSIDPENPPIKLLPLRAIADFTEGKLLKKRMTRRFPIDEVFLALVGTSTEQDALKVEIEAMQQQYVDAAAAIRLLDRTDRAGLKAIEDGLRGI